MTQYSAGDSVGDCPSCDASNAVVYRGGSEAVCSNCGSIYEVAFEMGEEGNEPPSPEVVDSAEVTPPTEPTFQEAPSALQTPPVRLPVEGALGMVEPEYALLGLRLAM